MRPLAFPLRVGVVWSCLGSGVALGDAGSNANREGLGWWPRCSSKDASGSVLGCR